MLRIALTCLFVVTALLPLSAKSEHGTAKDRRTRARTALEVVAHATPDILPAKSKATRATVVPTLVYDKVSKVNTQFREGIDVSRYQGTIDWGRVGREGGVSYVYIKATEGASLVDPLFYRNIADARAAGLSVGSYHFYRAHISVDLQVANMVAAVRKEDQDLVPMIDVEATNGVGQEKFVRDLREFVAKITAYYGVKPLLYTYQNFYNKHLVGEFPGYHWMMAKYRDEEPILDDDVDYIMWQYTQSGSVPGVRGPVDRSRIMGNHKLTALQMH